MEGAGVYPSLRRDRAATLFGEPEITMQMVDRQNGWLVAAYGHGVGGADSYVYRTHDGGASWAQAGSLEAAKWWPCEIALVDDLHAVIAIGHFNGSPVLVTSDGGDTWNQAQVPLAGDTWEAQEIQWTGTELSMTAEILSRPNPGQETLRSYDWGETWRLDPT